MPVAFPPEAQPCILVTGGSGFLGSQVLSLLKQRGTSTSLRRASRRTT